MFKSKPKSVQVRDSVRDHVRDSAKDLAEKLGPHVETARDKASPVLADAREKAAPVISEARLKAAPVIADTKDRWNKDVVPTVAAAVTAASEASEPYRTEARKRGKATAAALRGEVVVQAPKKRRGRRFVAFLGLVGIGALVAKYLSDRQSTTAWQSSYQPTSTPSPATGGATASPDVDDEAAATPGEAMSDSTDVPHPATTPDRPAEQVDLKKE